MEVGLIDRGRSDGSSFVEEAEDWVGTVDESLVLTSWAEGANGVVFAAVTGEVDKVWDVCRGCGRAGVTGEDNRVMARKLAFQRSLYLRLCCANIGRA